MDCRKRKVLIIEDDPDILENISEILEIEGFHTFRADDGLHAIVMALSHKPDLVICDMLIHAFDGCRVLEFFKKNPVTCSIPFVFLSANLKNSDLQKCRDLGADYFITKPYRNEDILECVWSFFERPSEPEPATLSMNLEINII